MAVVGNLYQLNDNEKNGNRCLDILSKAHALLKVTPYRSIEHIDKTFKEKISETWFNIGLKLYQSNQMTGAIQVFADSDNELLQIKLAEAWFNIGIIYYEMGREEQGIFYWKKIGERYKDSSNSAIRAIVNKSAVNIGQVLMLLNENSTFRTISNQK